MEPVCLAMGYVSCHLAYHDMSALCERKQLLSCMCALPTAVFHVDRRHLAPQTPCYMYRFPGTMPGPAGAAYLGNAAHTLGCDVPLHE